MKLINPILIILIVLFASCKQKNEKINTPRSNFNLLTDYADFKTKMNDKDTIQVFINHSICTYHGAERITIIKLKDSLIIRDEYLEKTYGVNDDWELAFQRTISENDTIWDFGEFLKANAKRTSSKDKKYGRIQINYKLDTIHYFNNGLIDALEFLDEYNMIMTKLYPMYLKDSFGIQLEEIEIVDEKEIKETELTIE